MKVKLLKRLREDFKYKFKDEKCYLYRHSDSKTREFENIQNMILECYCFKSGGVGSDTFWLDWDWHSIYFRYKHRIEQREFDRI